VSEARLIVIGVDPGAMTGIACFSDDTLSWTRQLSADAVTDIIGGYLRTRQTLATHDRIELTIIIAVERYNIGATTVKKTRQPAALEVTGQLEQLARELNVMMVKINASDAKRIGSKETLQRIKWYDPINRHANDACSQVLAILARRRPSVFAEIVGV
jgi:hypothetical protein